MLSTCTNWNATEIRNYFVIIFLHTTWFPFRVVDMHRKNNHPKEIRKYILNVKFDETELKYRFSDK